VTAQENAYARFRRALDAGSPVVALAAATELRQLGLTDSLELCLVLRGDPSRYARAVARWRAKYVTEGLGLHLPSPPSRSQSSSDRGPTAAARRSSSG
jgi:hypothetical protein